jgi:hypothetical protein
MSGPMVGGGKGEERACVSGQTVCRVVMAGQPPRDMTLDELLDAYGRNANLMSPKKRESLTKVLAKDPAARRSDRRFRPRPSQKP